MAKRPAEALASRIDRMIKHGGREPEVYHSADYRLISVRALQSWRQLAKSIDARFRLDGSPKNKRKRG